LRARDVSQSPAPHASDKGLPHVSSRAFRRAISKQIAMGAIMILRSPA
jgi:hypothetical protein